MARQPLHQDEGCSGPGEWVVSFNDCMTNMLCFFVLLVSFSSFDTASRSEIAGAFQSMNAPSIVENQVAPRDAVVDPVPRRNDPTREGSEKPTNMPPTPTRNPLVLELPPDIKPYADRVVIAVPWAELFHGEGTGLTPKAHRLLGHIAAFLSAMNGEVIVRECLPREGSVDRSSDLERAWKVLAVLRSEPQLAGRSFAVGQAATDESKPLVEIVLIKRRQER